MLRSIFPNQNKTDSVPFFFPFFFLKSALVAASLSNMNVQSAMGKSIKNNDPIFPNARVHLHKVNAGT